MDNSFAVEIPIQKHRSLKHADMLLSRVLVEAEGSDRVAMDGYALTLVFVVRMRRAIFANLSQPDRPAKIAPVAFHNRRTFDEISSRVRLTFCDRVEIDIQPLIVGFDKA